MKKTILLIFLITVFLLFTGCKTIPPEVTTANKMTLKVVQKALLDQQKSNDSVLVAVELLLQKELKRQYDNSWPKLLKKIDGEDYIKIKSLNKFNDIMSQKQKKIKDFMSEINRKLRSNEQNAKLAVRLLTSLVKIQDEYNKQEEATNTVMKNINEILDIYQTFQEEKKGERKNE